MAVSELCQKRRDAIVAEVVQFEACTMMHLRDACCPEISLNTTNKEVNFLVRFGHLMKHTLDESTNRRFFVAGPRTNARLGRPKKSKPLGPEQLQRALASAAYCRLPGIMRPRLTLEELCTRFPGVDVAHFHQNALYDDLGPDRKSRLAALHLHFSLSPSQRIAECEKHVERLVRVPEFGKLLENDNDGLMLAIVTDRDKPGQIEQLRESLEDTGTTWAHPVKFRIGVIAPLLAPPDRNR